MAASAKQVAFFGELLDSREFPAGVNTEQLRAQFANLSKDAASKWIENALALPEVGGDAGDNAPPPF